METLKLSIGRHICLTLFATLMVGNGVIQAQEELSPDQNPNYKKSLEKYMAKKEELTKNEGTTVQATYKAIDDMQIKQERKDLRRSNRQDRRLARINNNGYSYNSPYYYSNSNYPYNYYGYNNYNSYPGYSPFNNYNNYYYRPACGLNTIGNAALWGLGAYLLLR